MDPITSDCVDGDIRLVGGSTALEGRVEVCLNNAWGAICDYSFHIEEAHVACGQLGFQRAGDFYYNYMKIKDRILNTDFFIQIHLHVAVVTLEHQVPYST